MPRLFNRKVEIRFNDNSLNRIDQAAAGLGLSRTEFIRQAALGTVDYRTPSEASSSVSKPPLTVAQYLTLVQHVHRVMGGAIGRSAAEACVAATLQKLFVA